MKKAGPVPTTVSQEEERSSFELEDFEINVKDDSRVLLGKGSFAKVYLARCRRDGKLYALKVVG